ncbi:MAG TPA: peroxiredoxin-like family protein [Spirochaetota bacterium]|nr:AhpC/TSA family protein [Spirochaetota bacterium]HOD14751.1 peroxiredoxin-like family protein [Spirochaetota bacterium]HPG49902.1 peroxiredoxin-like family protein [Spirochaetota bacterium]HPN11503.1 peroxiredoxin-like family protein [Spirochaetota bacterium]HQL82442.1 peroxiredoxin-like family protein [Spirochaetota bacterium]
MNKKLTAGMKAPNFSFTTLSGQSLDFYKTSRGKKAVLFFLRYAGCPICQMKMGEIMRDYDRLRAAGLEVYVVLQSSPASVKEALAGVAPPFTIVCDPREKIFSLYGVPPGNLFQYLAPSVIMKAIKASRRGFRHGKKEGQELQLPAVFIVSPGEAVTFAYYGRNIGDVPDNDVILNAARA